MLLLSSMLIPSLYSISTSLTHLIHLPCWYLENTYKISLQETFKKSFRNFISKYLYVRYFEETKNNYQNWHCLSGSNIFIKFIKWLTFYDLKKNKNASLLLPALLLPSHKTKKNVVSAQCYSRQNQCLIMKHKLFVFSAIYGKFYYQRFSLKLVLQKN